MGRKKFIYFVNRIYGHYVRCATSLLVSRIPAHSTQPVRVLVLELVLVLVLVLDAKRRSFVALLFFECSRLG